MANAASDDRIKADIRPPDFRAAVTKIRSIEAKKTKISSLNGEVADIWAKVEGHKVNKDAGKTFRKLDKMELAERMDFMRSLNGLIDAAGWPKEDGDLVDGAEGNVVHMRVGGAAAGEEEPAGDEEEQEQEEDPDPSRGARRGSPADRLRAGREHLYGKEKGAAAR